MCCLLLLVTCLPESLYINSDNTPSFAFSASFATCRPNTWSGGGLAKVVRFACKDHQGRDATLYYMHIFEHLTHVLSMHRMWLPGKFSGLCTPWRTLPSSHFARRTLVRIEARLVPYVSSNAAGVVLTPPAGDQVALPIVFAAAACTAFSSACVLAGSVLERL